MGRYNSSLTRLQPVLRALCQLDPTGRTWLRTLLEMGNRHESTVIPTDLGDLESPPAFELPVDPPKALLEWLVMHPEELCRPSEREWGNLSPTTRARRGALLSGDQTVRHQALEALQKCQRLPGRCPWWCFEGKTRVDGALLTPTTVVFLEGKRFDVLAKDVTWYSRRNQVLRVLDCAAQYACQTGRTSYFVLLVVEGQVLEHSSHVQGEATLATSPEVVARSLPHRSVADRERLLSRYLGLTTWEAIVRRFQLPKGTLLKEVESKRDGADLRGEPVTPGVGHWCRANAGDCCGTDSRGF